MRARKFSARALLGMLAAAACSGGGGANGGSVPDPNQTGGQDTPPSGIDVPPSDIDNPPGGDTPPGDDSPGSASGDVPGATCAKLCNAFFANQCACPGDDVGACTAGCNAALARFGPCIEQTNSLVQCVITSPSFFGCNVFQGDVEAGDYGECTIQAVNFVRCFQLNDFEVDDIADDTSNGLGDCGAGGASDGGGKGGDGPGKGGPQGGNGPGQNGTGGMAGSGMATGGVGGL